MTEIDSYFQDIYYEQSQYFTCGAACTIMALTHLKKIKKPKDYILELEIWRQANSIYMGSGHPGCGPYGLAKYLLQQGLHVEILRSKDKGFFSKWNNNDHKKERVDLDMEKHDLDTITAMGCKFDTYPTNGDALYKKISNDDAVISLYGENKIADGHWICAIKTDDGFVRLDPYYEEQKKLKYYKPEDYYKNAHYLNQRVALIVSGK